MFFSAFVLCLFALVAGKHHTPLIKHKLGSTPPPFPFNQTGGITVISNGQVLTSKGVCFDCEVVVSGSSIIALMTPSQLATFENGTKSTGIPLKFVDASGMYVLPGLIDVHVHVSGGGGEMGPYSRTPAANIEELASCGITTIVGLRGTDNVSRGLPDLLQKLNALGQDITTFMWTGGYRYPAGTLTDSVQSDLVLIDRVIGVGETALSDHRSSWPTLPQLEALISDARVGGMLSGKPGMVHFHMGSAALGMDLLWQVVNQTSIPFANIYPTHMSSRGPALLNEGAAWIEAGGIMDFTADEPEDSAPDTLNALCDFKARGLPLNRISVSSDGYGSNPYYDSEGNLVSYNVGNPNTTLATVQNLILQRGWALADALQFSTVNPANFLGLSQKGTLGVGADADIMLLDKSTLQVRYVFAMGEVIKTPTWVKTGLFGK